MKAQCRVRESEVGDNRIPSGSVSELQGVREELDAAIQCARDLLFKSPDNQRHVGQMLQLASNLCSELHDLIEPEAEAAND